MVHYQDVAFAISKIWTHESLAAFYYFGTRLYTTIVLNLLMDEGDRIGKILPMRKDRPTSLTWDYLRPFEGGEPCPLSCHLL